MAAAIADGSRKIATLVVLAIALAGGAQLQARTVGHQIAPTAPSAATGVKIFDKWCSDCHRPETGSGSMALQRRYKGAVPAILERRSDVSPELVKLAVRRGVSFMPSFRKTEISDAELDQVSAYLASSQDRKRSRLQKP